MRVACQNHPQPLALNPVQAAAPELRANQTSESQQSVKANLVVKLSIPFAPRGLELFTPTEQFHWGNTSFLLNPTGAAPCDFWIVHSFLAKPNESALVSPRNTLFINGEPPAKKKYPARFFQQFEHVVDTHSAIKHPRLQVFAPCIGWFVGMDFRTSTFKFGYRYLQELAPPKKENRVSVVCSNTAKTRGQRERLAFLHQLKARLGSRLVWYGRGFEPIGDKMEAIAPFRYHLVLENSVSPHYWTEKLADAYLGWGFPLYWGCPNLSDYFAPESFQAININEPSQAISQIEALLDADRPLPVAVLADARRRLLDQYNPFARYQELATRHFAPEPAVKPVVLYPAKRYSGWRNWWSKLVPRRRS